ncbi:hypothetical protein R3I93_001555 [Phoxinus phoxinus]|uniref:Transcription factor SOX-10 n=1 Tax=Phoxinus phoxinus TaxID=58324 RepID=A0AAN9DHF8_9TELE
MSVGEYSISQREKTPGVSEEGHSMFLGVGHSSGTPGKPSQMPVIGDDGAGGVRSDDNRFSIGIRQAVSQVLSSYDWDLVPSKSKLHVKRPMNAFMVWSQAVRKELADQNPSLHNSEISQILGKIWRQQNEMDKKPFIEEAERLRKKHKEDYPTYKYQPRRRKNRKTGSNSEADAHSAGNYTLANGHHARATCKSHRPPTPPTISKKELQEGKSRRVLGLEADGSQTSGLNSAFSYMGSSQSPVLDPGSVPQSHWEQPVYTTFGNVDIGEISHDLMANMEPFDVNELDQYVQASGGTSAMSSALPYAYDISNSLVATSGPLTAQLAQLPGTAVPAELGLRQWENSDYAGSEVFSGSWRCSDML